MERFDESIQIVFLIFVTEDIENQHFFYQFKILF